MSTETTQTCTRCGKEKNISEFSTSNFSKTGYMSVCKSCRSAAMSIAHQRRNPLTPPS